MRNPVRKIFNHLEFDVDESIANQDDVLQIAGVRAVSKLLIGFFSGAAVLTGLGLMRPNFDFEMEPETPPGETVEKIVEYTVQPFELFAFGIAVASVSEGVRMHRLASRRLEELYSGL